MNLYPFPAVLGQEDVKEAILLNFINPAIGGVLIDGSCGTAKSTLAKGCSALTSMNFCQLPINCSEDRLLGSIHIEKTMKEGHAVLEPGIIHRANGGGLLIDDIDLLPDHIADVLQNIVSTGEVRLERDGISNCFPCKLLLIATMNSSMGQIRKGLVDHFGLYARTTPEGNLQNRVEMMRRRQSFDDSAAGFCIEWQGQSEALVCLIQKAKDLLPKVEMTETVLDRIAQKLEDSYCEGHRGDLVMCQTVRAVAAFHGRTEPLEEDINEAAYFALPHRTRMTTPLSQEKEEQQKEREGQQEQEDPREQEKSECSADQSATPEDNEPSQAQNTKQRFKSIPRAFAVGPPFQVVPFAHKKDRQIRNGWGRRTQTKTESTTGRYLYPTMERRYNDLALDATIRAAAPYQTVRPHNGTAIAIRTEDIRERVRQKKVSNLLVLVVDASGSMGARERMVEAKGAVLSLLKDAYVKRDKIAMVTFRGTEAQVILPPTRSVERGYALLQKIQTGGKTPLNAGITKALTVIQSQLRQQPELLPMLIVITDGKGNVSMDNSKKPVQELIEIGEKVSAVKQIETMIIDIERGGLMQFGIAKKLAEAMGGKYCKLDQLKSNAIVAAIAKERNR